ncbi:MAG TPA: hypothetical protein VMY78_02520 [Solirubrobacteraceae bacterium]|nr:hypothetical protein [Solirubrobacteraceae bacterium]
MTATRTRGTPELARVRRRRRRRSTSPCHHTGGAYLLAKLLAELDRPEHTCSSCGWDMAKLAEGFWSCENCAELGASRRRRSFVGSRIGRPS